MAIIRARPSTHNRWPLEAQPWLLKAAFLSGRAGLTAWKTWRQLVNLDDHPDPASFRLLPQLYQNLQTLGIDDPLLQKLKGIARQAWYKNQRYFLSIVQPLQVLQQSGIETILLYGPALALAYANYYPITAISTLPILVRAEEADVAIRRLQALGWQPESGHIVTNRARTMTHSQLFSDSLNRRIQLHWHLLPECCDQADDQDFWQNRKENNLQDTVVYTLDSTNQLFHVCVQDTIASAASPFHRAVNAMTVINYASEDLDWAKLATLAGKRSLALSVISTINYLHQHLKGAIPAEASVKLQSQPVSRFEQVEFKAKNSRSAAWRRGSRLWFNYLRQTDNQGLPRRVIGFPEYLKASWHLESIGDIPKRAFSATMEQTRN